MFHDILSCMLCGIRISNASSHQFRGISLVRELALPRSVCAMSHRVLGSAPAQALQQSHNLLSLNSDILRMPTHKLSKSDAYRIQESRRRLGAQHSVAEPPQSTIHSADRLPSPQSEPDKRSNKRKRDTSLDEEAPLKKCRKEGVLTPASSPGAHDDSQSYGFDIHWAEYFGSWPRKISRSRALKRTRSSTSYSQSVREGSSPAAYTRQHEVKMLEAGLVMADFEHLAQISEDCKRLCDALLKKEYELPDGSCYQLKYVSKILARARPRNEARVNRDVRPLMVPSAELLYIEDHPELEHVCEALDAEWTRCDTICGPRPKPDFAVGISPSAFSEDEISKLTMSHTSACPNMFPENMHFPFLICEVKGTDRPIVEAERQAMHSASIAGRAIIQLCKKASPVEEFNQRILVFSVAHDPVTVKIYGHFAKIDGDKITFFRHQLFSEDFAADAPTDRWSKAYQITRAIYDIFYPQHLARIKNALSQMPHPTLASFASHLEIEGDSQDSASELSSQENDQFKKPSLPSSIRLQQENDNLLQLLREQQAESKRQREEQREQMERQMAQQREQSAEQKAQLERQMAQQEKQSAEQKEQLERQMAQQAEIIALLKESKSR